MEVETLAQTQIDGLLYHKSGLLGMSGLSFEPRVLLANETRSDDVGGRRRVALAL